MTHTLLEQTEIIAPSTHGMLYFLRDNLGMTVNGTTVIINSATGIHFIASSATNTTGVDGLVLYAKDMTRQVALSARETEGDVFYHISKNETTKYFKMNPHSDFTSYDVPNTFILAQDINNEWVVFYNEKMYTDYGATGIYANPQDGSHSNILSDGNLFMISEAYRYDTGVKFKDLFFVLSATSYSDRNCIIEKDGVKYRLVSVSNHTDAQGRYPSFAFPVSD